MKNNLIACHTHPYILVFFRVRLVVVFFSCFHFAFFFPVKGCGHSGVTLGVSLRARMVSRAACAGSRIHRRSGLSLLARRLRLSSEGPVTTASGALILLLISAINSFLFFFQWNKFSFCMSWFFSLFFCSLSCWGWLPPAGFGGAASFAGRRAACVVSTFRLRVCRRRRCSGSPHLALSLFLFLSSFLFFFRCRTDQIK